MHHIADMTIGQLAGSASIIIALAATLIQISPIKINPWSYLARKIGRALNKEVIEKVDKLENELTSLKNSTDEGEAKSARARILRFGDEIAHGVKHSKEHFDDILADITDYELYCASHVNFKNNRTGLTSKLIKETYEKCMKTHDFI